MVGTHVRSQLHASERRLAMSPEASGLARAMYASPTTMSAAAAAAISPMVIALGPELMRSALVIGRTPRECRALEKKNRREPDIQIDGIGLGACVCACVCLSPQYKAMSLVLNLESGEGLYASERREHSLP